MVVRRFWPFLVLLLCSWTHGAPVGFYGAAVDANFATSQYTGGTLANLVSVSNSTGGYAADTSGNLTSFSANTPRITNQGLLIEGAGSNLLIQTSLATGWTPGGAALNANTIVSPDGTTNATFLQEDTSTGGHNFGANAAITKPATASQYVWSAYLARSATGSPRDFALTWWNGSFQNQAIVNFNLQTGIAQYNGTPQGAYINKGCLPASRSFWLCYVAITSDAVANFNLNMALINNSTTPWASTGSTSYTGDNASGIYIFAPQIETGTFPTSRMICGASPCSRSADVVTVTGAAATALNSAAGTATVFAGGGETFSAAANVLDSNGTPLLGFTSADVLTDGVTSSLSTTATGNRLAANDYMSIAWNGSGRSLYLNGGAAVTDAVAQTPSATLHLGSTGAANFLNGYVQRMAIWATKQASPQSNFPLVAGTSVLGVGISGPENGTPTFPLSGDWSYLGGKGVKTVRLALAWENLQPTLASALDTGYVSSINTALASAAANGICLILDLHNYAHYVTHSSWVLGTFPPGNGGSSAAGVFALGDVNLPIADFTDVWTRTVTTFTGKSGLCGYGLMNEPGNLASNSTWNTAAQAAITAIRAIDASTAIYVSGDGTINTAGFAPSFYQPPQVTGTNLVYEAHQYWDYNPTTTTPAGPGVYTSNYSTFSTTNYQGIKSIQAWLWWLKSNNFKGYLGEYGVPNSIADNNPQWIIQQGHTEALLAQQGVASSMFFYGANNAGAGTTLQFNPQAGVDDPRFTQMIGQF